MQLNHAQREFLLNPIHKSRIGKDGKGFSHVEAWDIRRVLNGTFGFTGWSGETTAMEMIYEDEKAGRFNVGYRAQFTITVGDARYTEWAVGDCKNYPSRGDAHDMAIKTAESQAFKRAAMNLGDQFGLSLYDGGSLKQSIRATLDAPVGTADAPAKVSEFAGDLEIEPQATVEPEMGQPVPITPDEPQEAPSEPEVAVDPQEWIDRLTPVVKAGDVAAVVALKQEMAAAGVLDVIYKRVTLSKWADKGVIEAGKVVAA